MVNFFKSIFPGKEETEEELKARNEEKNFDILKYDGIRATKMCGKLPYAIKCFTEALNIKEDMETRTLLASAYLSFGKPEEALLQANKMVELEPENIEARLIRIHILFLLDRDSEVPADCQAIISVDPDNYMAYFQMAKAKKATGDVFGAIADLTKAIALKDDFAGAYQLRAEVFLLMRQGKEALEDISKVIELTPEEETAYLLRGRVHALMNDAEKAEADFSYVLELNPFQIDAYLLKSSLMTALGKNEDALAFIDEAIEVNTESGALYAERGRIRNILGDKKGAFEDVKKSVELNPNGEVAQMCNGQHSNFGNMYKGGIF